MKNIIVFLFAVLSCTSMVAQADISKCIAINKLPYAIYSPGVYCLKKNLTYAVKGVAITSDVAIPIYSTDVTLDLNGFVLSGGNAPADTNAFGISIENYDNVIVRNGKIQNFKIGLFSIGTSENHLIENLVFSDNTVGGIMLLAQGSIIRNNTVINTGGSTAEADSPAHGIFAVGYGNRILDNTVSGVTSVGSGLATGIGWDEIASSGTIVKGNTVTDIVSPGGISMGIYFVGGARNLAIDNRVNNAGTYCIAYGGTGTYMGNLVSGCDTAYLGGTAAGSTNY